MKRYILSIVLMLTTLLSYAQISIGGDVYGGGKQGAVNMGNTTGSNDTEKESITLLKCDSDATSVTITDRAIVRTVFGGGKNGRCYGQTNVTVDGGKIGASKWTGTVHGGLFGAGDGASAYVFGKENTVLIKGGALCNNVYGGGNQADLMGSTKVTLQCGTFHGSVFGGARMANIYGHSFVKLDGANVPTDSTLIIPTVYGGNDVAGTIALSDNWDWTKAANIDITGIPVHLRYQEKTKNLIDNTWNAFVASTYKDAPTNNIFVGNLYGGGNGDYEYAADGSLTMVDTPSENGSVETTTTFTGLSKPTIGKTYLNLVGGTFGYVYGGGNNATVTESADMLVWNAHFDFTNYTPYMASIPASRISEMGVLQSMFTITGSGDDAVATSSYQIDRIFGGNNKAEMSIQPHWYLAQGTFNNIYSGGNKGDMTCPDGILVNIGSRSVFANNVYGGCRMADVHPKDASGNTLTSVAEQTLDALKVKYKTDGTLDGLDQSTYTFEKDYPARVYITEGHINNVYGGNDISGRVYLGTNVAIAGAISGNVFGGGNGSYAYTDNATLGDAAAYADLYYTPGSSSIDALNAYRPHVDNTLLHIWGNENQQPSIAANGTITATDAAGNATAEQPVIVTGGVYCGGNSAAIESTSERTPKATFKIGKNVIINSVFMGSNGENMVTSDILATHASTVSGQKYSSFDLRDATTFASYMEGCAVNILPTVTFDWTLGEDPHAYIGSFYGGGNVGSQSYTGPITLNMPEKLIIYDRVVGGCNNADVAASTNNAAFEGGIITANTGADASTSKVTINMDSYLEPRELTVTRFNGFLLSAKLDWDFRKYYQAGDATSSLVPFGANVFGGCYTSGHVNGDVTINISKDLISPTIFSSDFGTKDDFINMGSYLFSKTMAVYGGGYGAKTSIWGDAHVNLSDKARVISVKGGADFGNIGKSDVAGNTYVTCANSLYDYSKSTGNGGKDTNLPYNAVQVYGGAFAGTIYGHTDLRLNGGTFRNVFGGSCDADITGYASLYIGAHDGSNVGTGYPYIEVNAYGGNDFGGYITGANDYKAADDQAGYNDQTIRTSRYVEYNAGRIGGSIYGGSYGSYDYDHNFIEWNYLADGKTQTDQVADGSCTNVSNDYQPSTGFHYPHASDVLASASGVFPTNTFVNVRSQSNDKTNDLISSILGGGRGVMNKVGIVDAGQTYVYLHGADWKSRLANLSSEVYGGGYYSIVQNTKVDALTGCTGAIYGGSYGTSAANLNTAALKTINYNSTRTEVNLYDGMDNSNMAIYGGGGYAGSATTNVNLYGGKAANVYGGSFNEGYCATTNVNVPSTSTASVNAIFGGGYGNDVSLPCDENETHVTFSSALAFVTGGVIYGGNNAKRAAKKTNVVISAPVKTSATGSYVSICGAGNGPCSVAGYTNVTLEGGAIVNNVYGGGRDGKVFGYYENVSGAPTYYGEGGQAHLSWKYETSSTASNTNIQIQKGATAQNVYAGGYGEDATVAGSTSAANLGGTISGNLFGGGYSGDVLYQQLAEKATDPTTNATVTLVEQSATAYANQTAFNEAQKSSIYTSLNYKGGSVNNIYGGGYNGQVGSQHDDAYQAETRIEIGVADQSDYYNGDPIVLCSVYGGGYRGAVLGTARINMNNGHIGYSYTQPSGAGTGTYTEHLNATADDTNNLLKESGNIFGGGYGEGATTDHTVVNMFDGTIRNSLYGGGEIASVGVAVLTSINSNDRTQIPNIEVAGSTEVNMYGGLVSANVFGGGRGYAIDAYGNTKTGEVGYSDGYTFGKTNVNIYRGTIGTDATLEEGSGNVFGGGNIGYVYGADKTVTTTSGFKNVTKHTGSGEDGYYHLDGGAGSGLMSEDCKVVITPVCKVLNAGSINGISYQKDAYIGTDVLNTITVKTEWNTYSADDGIFGDLDKQGVIIRNAVFAGGNVSAGSDKVYANTYTVYGNATASVVDCQSKDLVTLGADEIGGLYGDGNLTFVDGYRELNVTNYGTDYYQLGNQLAYDDYLQLNDRERAYFELKYVCTAEYGSHSLNEQISGSDYNALPDGEKGNWVQKGFCTLYAGRIMNTIQRADFCGVFGSRIVLKGAQDRVPSEIDYTNYSINRVGELSLNQVGGNGNYFGIYNVVNYLGALSSDVKFSDTRTTTSQLHKADATYSTYLSYKQQYLNFKYRNNGTSQNKIALASGVWLEIVKQLAESSADQDVYSNYTYEKGEKIYGPITGIVELDLINAATGEGGGYVYALNEHGTQYPSGVEQTTLTSSNNGATSYKQYSYSVMDASTKMETSGNFVNDSKQIVDDCYPYNSAWLSNSKSHYWYVRGDYYVYDHYISAYTGATMAYAQSVTVPLTITAQAQGKLQLKNVQQNLNAYWTAAQYATLDSKYKNANDANCIIINGNTYYQNTPITYWDWAHLDEGLRGLFTTDTYVCNKAVGVYSKGQVLTQSEYATAKSNFTDKYLVESDIVSTVDGSTLHSKSAVIDADAYNALTSSQKEQCCKAIDCFNVTNAVTVDNGFLLTYDWDNPAVWNDYYIKSTSHTASDMILASKKTSDYTVLGPSYHCTNDTGSSSIYGQTSYNVGDVVDQATITNEPDVTGISGLAEQATFESAYVAKTDCHFSVTSGETTTSYDYVKGAAISTTLFNGLPAEQKTNFESGYICTTTFQVSDDKYYICGDVISNTEYTSIQAQQQSNFASAYICTQAGAWGGKLYTGGANYPALDVCSLSDEERKKFVYNLDAFETLLANSTSQTTTIDNYVVSDAYKNLGNYADRHNGLYAAATSIDFTATYTGSGITLQEDIYVNGSATATNQLVTGNAISNVEYDKLVNEKSHYSEFTKESGVTVYYFVTSPFWIGDVWHAEGSTITLAEYNNLGDDNKAKVTTVDASSSSFTAGEDYYFCKTAYTPVTSETTISGTLGAQGSILNATQFGNLLNEQANFEIVGTLPTETSTLYVNSHVDIDDLNEDKIVTVIYEYSYMESNESGTAFDNVKERHIVNIHIQFESGQPTIGELLTPPAVLPGSVVGLNQPSVTKGAYEILGGGWEIYKNEQDALDHKNGQDYTNNSTKMYWYQNGYQVAYYAKSYLGKTYSNAVPLTVANYHRMADVVANGGDNDGDHVADYMYLNKLSSYRDAKVYIKDAAELDDLADFYELTKGGNSGFENIPNCQNLDFIVDGDIDHSASWTSIGESGNCFSGNFHGDGHTISGLDHSLFGSFCGNIYNTGVAGSFTGSGIADAGSGNAYNCWVVTTGDVTTGIVKPVYGGTGVTQNCYYYNNYSSTRDGATKMPLRSFLDGEVAYKLNSYYLAGPVTNGYVETRYGNEDFIYADGAIPMTSNIRKSNIGTYAPISPDDYIFFGQNLSFNLLSSRSAHVEHPEAIHRITNADDESLNTKKLVTDEATDNRVYHAPGYYKSKAMGTVYFNKPAAFSADYTLSNSNIYAATTACEIHKDLTAIDFTCRNDASKDYAGISQFATSGLTRNLLVYADPTNDAVSYAVLNAALPEATLSIDAQNLGYNEVAIPADAAKVKGHLVDLVSGGYKATRDHYLVDKEFFNCPISYQFADDYYMWYQRKPDNYVDAAKGWEAISLPFTADLVSTQTKGEVTHFYGSSTTGHEYWLREFKGISSTVKDASNKTTAYANFAYPAAAAASQVKTDDNTFLWDYYYSHDDDNAEGIDKDKNTDSYQTYYDGSRVYEGYPYYTAAVPYIVGFPGSRYYEFDMSGTFVPANRANSISAIDAQTISFVSTDEAVIKVSDDELVEVSANNYAYVPNYMNKAVAAGSFVLNSEGSSFDKIATAQVAVPFRPYFTAVSGGAAPAARAISSICLTSAGLDKGIEEKTLSGKLTAYAKKGSIVVESGLDYSCRVAIHSTNGSLVASFVIASGETIETPVPAQGIYIVHSIQTSGNPLCRKLYAIGKI